MLIFSGVLMRALMMIVAFVIYRNIPDIAGWHEYEVYFIMSLMFISERMCNLLFDGIWSLPSIVFNGEFDVFLSRPISLLYQVLSYGMGLQGIGVLFLGFISLLLSLISMNLLSFVTVLESLLFIVCGTLIRMSVYLISSSVIFWFDSGGSSTIPFTVFSIGEYAKYPVSVYPKWMQFILIFVIPFGFIGFIPALIIRGEQSFLYCFLLSAVTGLFLLIAKFVFYNGVKHYESMGM